MKKKSRIHRKNFLKIITAAEAVTALCIIGCTGKFIFSMMSNIAEVPQISAVQPEEQHLDALQPDESSVPCTYINKNKTEAFDGQLVLVNNNHGYRFADNTDVLIPAHEIKNSSYSLIDHSVILRKETIEAFNSLFEDFEAQAENFDELYEIIIQSGYRSVAKQSVIYNDDLAANGTHTSSKAAKPGCSEHHTGYAADLALFNNGGSVEYDGTGDYKWINDNCYKYGFIVRYKAGKSDITGIESEPWHFRYVGVPHSYAVEINSVCYEEYIKLLKNFSYEKPYTITIEGGKIYQIYYVPLDEDKAEIPVPDNFEYSISGNNVDGFIITVEGEFNPDGSENLMQ